MSISKSSTILSALASSSSCSVLSQNRTDEQITAGTDRNERTEARNHDLLAAKLWHTQAHAIDLTCFRFRSRSWSSAALSRASAAAISFSCAAAKSNG